MKITKKELSELIKESVNKKVKLDELNDRKQKLQESLNRLYEDDNMIYPPMQQPVEQPVIQTIDAPEGSEISNDGVETEEVKESIFDSKPGETVVLNFEGVTLKLKRQLDDLFKVVDATESAKLKEGDYIKVQGDDILKNGKSYTFSVIRQIDPAYKTNPLVDWRIIKN